MRQLLPRAALSLLGGSIGGVAVAALDARWIVDGATAKLSFGDVFVAALGLDAPVALAVSAACGAALIAASPREAPTLGGLSERLRDPSRRLSATLALGALAVPVFVVTTAHAARGALGADAGAKVVGAELAATAALIGAVLVAAVVAASRPVARWLARLDGRVAPLVGVALAAAVFAHGIHHGTPGGDGGALGVLGVLKRQELDLRAPALVLLIAASAAIGPSLRAPWPVAALLALLPLSSLRVAATSLDASQALSAGVERGAPLARVSLKLARRATDRDKDGFSRTFGGGDCDDRDARVYPTAIDEPENGVDEDCSGRDAKRPAPPPAPAPTPSAPTAAAPKDLNVLLITVDTLRADLGYAGNARALSPNLDKLAAQAAVYENAVSLASYTGKSVGPMLSGKYPSETHRGWSHFNSFPKADRMVQERLQAASIRTLSVQAHWYFDKCCGLARGFDVVDSSAAPGMGAQQDNDTTTTGDKLTDAAIKRLGDPATTGGRFFAWVHYLDPHSDYLRHQGVPDFGRDMRAQYDHEVAFTDREVGRLLDFVAAQPWGEHTAIIVTSDHGEAFGEHKMIRHGLEVWEELVRVPLIVRVPGAAPRRIAERRGAIDLVPTILELFAVRPAFDGGPTDFVSGVSLLPEVMGAPAPARDVLVDMPAGPNNDEKRAFYRGSRKLYVSSGVAYSMYDLAKDPGEKEDLAGSDKAGFAELREAYDAMKSRLREVRVKPIPK